MTQTFEVRSLTSIPIVAYLDPVIDGLNAFRLAGENLTVPDGSDESIGFYAKDCVTKVTGFCDSDGEEVEFITDGIVDFVGTGLERITENGQWRESADGDMIVPFGYKREA